MPFFSGEIPLRYSEGTYQERIMDPGARSDGQPQGFFRNNQHYVVLSLGKLFSFYLPRTPGTGVPLLSK